MTTEYRKKELTFKVNSFNLPKTMKEVEAWANQIIMLLRYEPGCIPDMPEVGLAVDKAHYQDMAAYSKKLKTDLEYQLETYFPDIPVSSINVYGEDTVRGSMLIIGVEFLASDVTQTAYIKALKSDNSRLFDFEINF